MKKVRLDVLLVERALVESRESGRRFIMAGEVFVDNQLITKPGTRVNSEADLRLKAKPRFVSRGGEKLAHGLEVFDISPSGWVCADVGASTGGFTDCLLQNGAQQVYTIDVGYGQLSWKLRQDDRVIVMERTNARYLEDLPSKVDLVTCDASFISLRLLIPQIYKWMQPDGSAVVLVKPQFEAGRSQVGKGGVVRDRAIHREVLAQITRSASDFGFGIRGMALSPLTGPAGNHEFLLWLNTVERETNINQMIDSVLDQVPYTTS